MEKKEIKGILYKGDDVELWDDKKFNDYYIFLDFLVGKDGKVHVTRDAVHAAQKFKLASPMISEILERIDVPLNMRDPDVWNYRKFYMRLQTVIRIVNTRLKVKPSLLIPALVKRERVKAHCAWMNDFYDEENIPKQSLPAPKRRANSKPLLVLEEDISPAQKLINAIDKVANIYNLIADSIEQEDIDRLDVKDKINALQKLSYLYGAMKKTPPKNLKVININTKTGSKEELEEALLSLDDTD